MTPNLMRRSLPSKLRRAIVATGAPLVLTGASFAAGARDCARPIRWVVPFAAGGNTDWVARSFAHALGDEFGHVMQVENRTGAGAATGSALVARSAPDGCTVLVGTCALAAMRSMFRWLPFNPATDLVPVALLTDVPMVLSVHTKLPSHDARQFVQLLARQPMRYSFGSSGNAGSLHRAVGLFMHKTRTSAIHVPYSGAGPALNDLAHGHIDFLIDPISTSLPLIKAGTIRALGVTTQRRCAVLPDLPTLTEQGIGYENSTWNMLFVPAKTPQPAIHRLAAAVDRLARDGPLAQRMSDAGIQLMRSTPELAAAYLEQETAYWSATIRRANIQPV
jgi:tripartite-type tricarboxylate transporter receptor subunit TctC